MIQKLAKEKNIPAKISGNKICVNNITYDHTNLGCLPVGLRLEDARIRVKIQGVMFTSAEQAYQYVTGGITLRNWLRSSYVALLLVLRN